MKILVGVAAVLTAFVLSTAAWADPRPAHPAPSIPQAHVERHVTMTAQMRSMGADGRMHDDDRWRSMREPAHVAAEEHHHAAIDRMLARPGR